MVLVSAARKALEEFCGLYGVPAGEAGPGLMVREVFGAEPDDWQDDALRAYGRGEREISIASCHGTGKTTYDAWCIIHQLLTRFPQKTIATAPSVGQLEDALVAEVLMWFHRLPPILQSLYEVKKNRIELISAPEESFFSARTARAENPEALQGVHAPWVLLVGDEASGIPEPIFVAGAGSMSGENATTILTSNPVRASGFFFETHHKNRGSWWTMQISGVEGTPGCRYSPRVSPDFVKQIADNYGDDSNIFRVRVLGLFPKSDEDTIIPFELCVSAQERDILVPSNMQEVWGVDVARFGTDSTVLLRRNGIAVLPRIEKWHGLDLAQSYGRLKLRYEESLFTNPPERILVDSIGYGAALVDLGVQDGLPVEAVAVSERPSVSGTYHNLRAELWFKARDWLTDRSVKLPQCDGSCTDRAHCVHEELIGQAARSSTSTRRAASSSWRARTTTRSGRGSLHRTWRTRSC